MLKSNSTWENMIQKYLSWLNIYLSSIMDEPFEIDTWMVIVVARTKVKTHESILYSSQSKAEVIMC